MPRTNFANECFNVFEHVSNNELIEIGRKH